MLCQFCFVPKLRQVLRKEWFITGVSAVSCLAALGVFFLRLLVVAIVGRSRIALISWSASLISVIARVEVLPGQVPVDGIDDHVVQLVIVTFLDGQDPRFGLSFQRPAFVHNVSLGFHRIFNRAIVIGFFSTTLLRISSRAPLQVHVSQADGQLL